VARAAHLARATIVADEPGLFPPGLIFSIARCAVYWRSRIIHEVVTLLARPIDRTALAHPLLGSRGQNTLMPLGTGKTETRYEGAPSASES
jgi:hypothetical protein